MCRGAFRVVVADSAENSHFYYFLFSDIFSNAAHSCKSHNEPSLSSLPFCVHGGPLEGESCRSRL